MYATESSNHLFSKTFNTFKIYYKKDLKDVFVYDNFMLSIKLLLYSNNFYYKIKMFKYRKSNAVRWLSVFDLDK